MEILKYLFVSRTMHRVLTFAGAVTLFTGCSMPAFDLQMILAYEALGKMDEQAAFSGVDISMRNNPGRTIHYIPSRSLGLDHGVVTLRDYQGTHVTYIANDPVEGNPAYVNNVYWDFPDARPTEVPPLVVPLIDSSASYDDAFLVVVPSKTGGNVELTTYGYIQSSRALQSAEVNDAASMASLGSTDLVHGLAVDITGTGSAVPLLMIAGVPTALDLYQNTLNDTAIPTLSLSGNVVLPGGETSAPGSFLYESSSNTFVYSFAQGDELFTTYTWGGGGTPTPIPVTRRVDAILSTGDLYSRGESTDIIYAADGTEKHVLPVGALHFAYETLAGTTPYLVYTLMSQDPSRYGDTYNIGIYQIALSDVAQLE